MKPISTILAAAIFSASNLFAFDQSHQKFTDLLTDTATLNGVKYTELKKEHAALKAYLKDLNAVTKEEFTGWSGDEQLAFLINLYNGSTLNLVLDHYPIKSFKEEIGGDKGPWKIGSVSVFGQTITLDFLENSWIRKSYKEPRIHFALNCASAGCPVLRAEAYTAKKLGTQLESQTRVFFANVKANNLKGNTLTLSPIFDWYGEDFVKKSGSVEAFVNPYFQSKEIKKGSVKITYSDYGWGLNDVK